MASHDGVLSSTLITAIDDLELAARLVVEGLRVGTHRSLFQGVGSEFHQHRPYRQGDDIKHLDWKIFGRSNRLYTRQFRETTNAAVMLVLDTSASMGFPEGSPQSKLRYGVLVAAALAWLAVEQGNAVGLMTLSGSAMQYLPARSSRVHLRTLLARLARLGANGVWDPPAAIGRTAELLQRRGIIIVLSDFYDREVETQCELRHVVQRGHDVAMLQLTTPDERRLSFDQQISLCDAETGEQLLINPLLAGDRYAQAHAGFLRRCEQFASRDGIDYTLLDVSVPPESALRDYLVRRGRGIARATASHPVHGIG